MSKIDRNNYEAFYLDYLEGNLSKEDAARLELFLEENADLKAELQDFELVEITPEPTIQFNKELLKKSITYDNVEDYIIASIEKQTTSEDETELHEFLKKTPEAQKLADRYQKTILPKLTLFYPYKNKLKKANTAVYYLTPLVSIAALLLIFLLLKSPSDTQISTPDNTQVAIVKEIGQTKVEASSFVKTSEDKEVKMQKSEQSILINNMLVNETKSEHAKVEKTQNTPERVKIQTIEPLKSVEFAGVIPQETELVYAYTLTSSGTEALAIIEASTNNSADDEHITQSPEKVVLASQENTHTKNTESLTVAQWLFQSAWKGIFKNEVPTPGNTERNVLLAAVAKKLDENSKRDIAYTYNTTESVSSYNIKLGKLEFSRIKNN